MRTLTSVAVFSFALLVLASQSVLAANWGGGIGVPGWEPFHPRYWAPDWGSGYSRPSVTGYAAPGVAATWTPQLPANTQVACVVNPSTNRTNLSFWVDNQQFIIPPGMQQNVNFLPGQTIQFDRGAGHGFARYSLQDTSYTFAPTSAGWELYRTVPTTASNIATSQPPLPDATAENSRSTLPAASRPSPARR